MADAPSAPAPHPPFTELPRLQRALGWRGTRGLVIALAVACAATSVATDWSTDDHFLRANLNHSDGATSDGGALDLFRFIDGDVAPRIDRGDLPWWTSPDARLVFLRPIAGLTHALDEAVAPGSAPFAHLHSLLWFALLLVAAGRLFDRLLAPPWLANLALVVYGLDDARGPTLGWIANRNALIAGVLVIVALVAHDRWRRDGWRPGAWVGPLAFALGLLSGEVALGGAGYLLAHALVFEARDPKRVLRALAPYAAIGLTWLVAYKLGGYGVRGVGAYLDPLAAPLDFVERAARTLPAILGGSLGVWSDFVPLVSGTAATIYLAVDLAVIAIFALLFRPVWRLKPAARALLLGAVLAALPLIGTLVADRALTLVSLGVSGIAALFLGQFVDPAERAPMGRAFAKHLAGPTAVIITLLWIIGGPLGLASRSASMDVVSRPLDEVIGVASSAPGRPVFVVNLPSDGLTAYVGPTCEDRGERCASVHALTATLDPVTVSRPTAERLVLRVPAGLFKTLGDRMLTRADRFAVGQRFPFAGGAVATIDRLGDDGRPTEVRVDFPTPLEDGRRRFVRFDAEGPHPWTPPAVGAEVDLPGIDAMAYAKRLMNAER